jgi:lipoprotein-anchoring transpeptidase ErfK/SrfK
MRRILQVLTILAFLTSFSPTSPVTAESALPPEDNAGSVLCQPGVYLESPGDCAPLGPSETLTNLAQMGLELPLRPLQVSQPSLDLSYVPFQYYRINPDTGTGFYPSLEAAIAKQGATRIIPPGKIIYIVYNSRIETDKKGTYFLLPSGSYMPGDGSTVQAASSFQGLAVNTTPRNAFGWVLSPADVRQQPNYLSINQPIRSLPRYTVVQIYSEQNIEGNEWSLIGPDEWVESRLLAAIEPNTTPPTGVTNGRWIDVNLAQQTLAVYDNNQMVFATLIATGVKPFYTRPGLFQIYKKKEVETMSGAFESDRSDYYYLENVPWTMYFDKARALHGAYWRTLFGYNASHGCVNLSLGDSHWLYDWANEGDWVWVHDPSGETPTDPVFYGDGGA